MSVMSNKNTNTGLQFNPSYFRIADKYATILTIISYPKFIEPGFISDVTNMSGIKVIMKHIPISQNVLRWAINKEVSEYHEQYEKENDSASKELIKQDYDVLVEFAKDLARNNDMVFDFQFHVMVTGNTREELEQRKINVKNYLASMELSAVSLTFEQETLLKSCLPIFPKQRIEERIGTPMSTKTLAGMYPYVFDSIKDPGLGNLIGIDFSGGVILFNQFFYKLRKEHNRNNANALIFGNYDKDRRTVGKLLLNGNFRNNCKIVAIDPEDDLENMCRLCEGKSINLVYDSQFLINPFEIVNDPDGFSSNNGKGYIPLERNIQFLKAFMKYYYEDIEENVLKSFSEIVQDIYHRFGINFETDFSTKTSDDYPTFTDVYEEVRRRISSINEKNQERDILERLEYRIRPFVRELKRLFDGHTSIKDDSDYVVFNFKEAANVIDENVVRALYFNTLKYAWSLCLDKNKDTVFYIDKVDEILSNKNVLGVNYLAQIQARTRIYNVGTIMIVDNINGFNDPAYMTQSSSIFKSTSYCFVLQLNKSEINALSKMIQLSDKEIDGIRRFEPEQALFVCGDKHMQIDFLVTEDELNFFGSGTGL